MKGEARAVDESLVEFVYSWSAIVIHSGNKLVYAVQWNSYFASLPSHNTVVKNSNIYINIKINGVVYVSADKCIGHSRYLYAWLKSSFACLVWSTNSALTSLWTWGLSPLSTIDSERLACCLCRCLKRFDVVLVSVGGGFWTVFPLYCHILEPSCRKLEEISHQFSNVVDSAVISVLTPA